MSIFMVCFGVGLAVSICLLYVHVCEIVMFYEQIRVSDIYQTRYLLSFFNTCMFKTQSASFPTL